MCLSKGKNLAFDFPCPVLPFPAKVTAEDIVSGKPNVFAIERAIMLATKISCPHCHKHLKLSKPPAAGHRVLCSRCGRSFAVSGDAIVGDPKTSPPPSPATAHEPTLPPPSPAITNEPTSPPLSLPRLDPPHLKAGPHEGEAAPTVKRQGLWIALILGGLLLLLSTTVALVLYFGLHKRGQDGLVNAAASASSADANVPSTNPPDDVPPPPPPPGTRAEDEDPRLLPEPGLTPTSTPAESERPWLPPEEQKRVNKAIDQGVKWLQKHQNKNGNWGGRVGLAALPALTLLECGVKADDVRIQRALRHVRLAIPKLQTTYDLALVILFLDRLGDPADKKRIQTCALRLVAGQSATGGWTYACPPLNPKQEIDLLTVMRARRPKSSLDLFIGGPGGSAPPGLVTRGPNAPLDKDVQGEPSVDSKLLPEGGVKPLDKDRPSPAEVKSALNRLRPELRNLPALQPPQKSHKMPHGDNTDNSNTQFAILGLLAAGHYDLPLERAYALIVHRFHVSQQQDGHWNYHFGAGQQGSPAMTGAGLLGLAVQYGLMHDQKRSASKVGQLHDPAVEKGFNYLARSIGKPFSGKKPRPKKREQINHYLLWSVERCGVLYKRRQIDGKDWYRWGAELLIDHQQSDGSWNDGGYYKATPTVDTCFALLFLKRANLAKELTRKLEFFMEGKQLQNGP